MKTFYLKLILFLKALKSFFTQNKFYNFSFYDLFIHLVEIFRELPTVHQLKNDGEFNLLSINSLKFFWPKKMPVNQLNFLYNEIFMTRNNPASYEKHEKWLKGSHWALDIGAHEGFFSYYAAINKVKNIVAMEPIEELGVAINKTFKEFYANSNIYIENKGVSSISKKVVFDIDLTNACDAKISNNSEGVEVELVTIDSIVDKYGFEKEGFIKMDIEGEEMNALLGAKDTIERFYPKLAIAVYHSYENALKCRDIILRYNPKYKVTFKGMNAYYYPEMARPYILYGECN